MLFCASIIAFLTPKAISLAEAVPTPTCDDTCYLNPPQVKPTQHKERRIEHRQALNATKGTCNDGHASSKAGTRDEYGSDPH